MENLLDELEACMRAGILCAESKADSDPVANDVLKLIAAYRELKTHLEGSFAKTDHEALARAEAILKGEK